MSDSKTEIYTCYLCKKKDKHLVFYDEMSFRKHYWGIHPKNKYEEAWSKHYTQGFKNWNGSTYYESSGPYY